MSTGFVSSSAETGGVCAAGAVADAAGDLVERTFLSPNTAQPEEDPLGVGLKPLTIHLFTSSQQTVL